MEVYLDNSATTKCHLEVADKVYKMMVEEYGNPSSMHKKGFQAEKSVKEAREKIAKILKIKEKEIFFTSGGTESNNLAIFGSIFGNKRLGNHIITTKLEHPSVLSAVQRLEDQGYQVTYLEVDEYGQISFEELEQAITKETIFVSMMQVNNEVGCCADLEKIGSIIKEKNPKTIFHVDGVQGFGKLKFSIKKAGIDLYTVSGHKIHGPKGIGFIYINEKVKIEPMLLGGGQQNGIRPGTDNVPGIVGIGIASELAYDHFEEKIEGMELCKERLIKGLLEMDQVVVHALKEDKKTAPHIVSAGFLGIRSEVLLHSLEEKGIYISAGSACSTHKREMSSSLLSIHVKKEYLESTVRFSLSAYTTTDEIDYCLNIIKETVPMLRKYARR